MRASFARSLKMANTAGETPTFPVYDRDGSFYAGIALAFMAV